LAPIVISLLLTGCIGLNNINKDLQVDETQNDSNIESTSGDNGNGLTNEDNPQIGVWSPDRKWVAVTNKVKSGNDTVLLEVSNNKKYGLGIFDFIKLNCEKYNYKINEEKILETNIDFLEWSPDSKKLLLSYGFLDDASIWQSGIAVFNLQNMSVEWLMKMNDAGNEYANVKKPDNFDWEGIGYGLEDELPT
jgi:hypothetical protein